MTLRGKIQNGHVQLEAASDLPDGTPVDVQPSKRGTLKDIFRRNAIKDPSMPKDYAAEVDHYLYGLPKRNGKAGRSGTGTAKSKRKGKAGAKGGPKKSERRA